ncbi:hypothetical protein [Methanosaeta sp. UBA458]|jgi:hypothetical protein|uniref:hypothetical protein n=1 Tax=Methanosaeta sp. UBA458 TaxID=1915561 RepID=UPI00257C8FF4|nr:hypothetical protein [Methanosaeta sp. UBA458]
MSEFYIMPDEDALEQAMQMDRAFFKQNPGKSEYCRLAIPGEDFGYFPPQTIVHVVNFGQGMRQRSFYMPPKEIWYELERAHQHKTNSV